MEMIEKSIVERIANIMGLNSAASQALKKAEEYEEPIFLKGENSIFVIDLKTIPSEKES